VPLLRPLADSDVPDVVALNQANLDAVSRMDEDRLVQLRAWADRFDVVEEDGDLAGFVVTFAPGAPYDSENYRWFAERHVADFYYLDRIVFADRFRRRGLGGFVYDALEKVAAGYGRMTLEVNLVPRNDASLAFHARRGYDEVGRLGDERYLVAMLEKTFR
jgi:predicted GNAT superfamily acetyltransferase